MVADHFFHSTTPTSGGKLVIMSPGHVCHYQSSFLESQMVAELLADGYDVLATYMPCARRPPIALTNIVITESFLPVTHRPASGLGLHPMGYFLDPVRRSLNHAMANYHYSEVYMVGLSGGGWTTTLYSALDPRIQVSVPVAGSWPFYFQQPPGLNSPSNPPTSYQDEEQNDDAAAGANGNDFYNFAGTKTGFLDLYVLGSYSHRQVQVVNRNDDCCFGQSQFSYSGPAPAPASWDQAVRAYEIQVANQIANLPHPGGSSGEFRVEINEATDCELPGPGYTCSGHVPAYHELSKNTRVNVVLSELDGATRGIDAGSGSLFARGTDSFFYQYLSTGWSSTGLQGIGTPAVVTSSVHQLDMFFRDPTNHLVHAYFNGSTWTIVADISAFMLSDPIAVSAGGQVQLVVIGTDYKIYRAAFINGAWTNWDLVPIGPYFAVGQVAVSTTGSTNVDIVFFRGHDARNQQSLQRRPLPCSLQRVVLHSDRQYGRRDHQRLSDGRVDVWPGLKHRSAFGTDDRMCTRGPTPPAHGHGSTWPPRWRARMCPYWGRRAPTRTRMGPSTSFRASTPPPSVRSDRSISRPGVPGSSRTGVPRRSARRSPRPPTQPWPTSTPPRRGGRPPAATGAS